MSEFKFSCPQCGQHILCDTGYCGTQLTCPGCQQAITVPDAPRTAAAPAALGTRQATTTPAVGQRFAGAGLPPKKKSGAVKIVVGVTVAALVLAAIGFFGIPFALHQFGVGKPKGNPSAQVAAPTANAAVQALGILVKMHSAYTNLTSVTADDTITLFLNLSNLTLADLNPDAAAKTKTPNRRPPGMPRMLTNTTELTIKGSHTNWYYFAGEAVSKIDRLTLSNTFAFWSSDQGRFMYTDAHRGKMSATYMQLPDVDPANNPAEQMKKFQQIFEDPAQLTKIVKDLGQTGDEPVNGQDCYTLTAKVLGQKVKIWVDKSTYLVAQWQITLGGVISDADVDDAFSVFSSAIPGAPAAQMEMAKAQVKKFTPAMAKIRGAITSTTQDIQTSATLTAGDFNYPVPSGVKLIHLPNMGARTKRTAP
jgi:hypothetical protein